MIGPARAARAARFATTCGTAIASSIYFRESDFDLRTRRAAIWPPVSSKPFLGVSSATGRRRSRRVHQRPIFQKLHGCRRIRPTLARPFRLSGMVVVLGWHDGLLLTTYPYVNTSHRKK